MSDETDPGAEARLLAPSLVGLDEADALRRAGESGFDPQVVPPGVTALTMDFRPRRIRLFVDESGQVTRATAG
ncbi:MAG: I78 family peptidase inhibitor [Nocardioides sp.]